jgi:hypothetical protein
MDDFDLLKEIVSYYQEEGLSVSIEKETSHDLISQLSVSLGADAHGRMRLLQIAIEPQHLRELTRLGPHHSPAPSHWRLSFEMEFPFKGSPKTASELLHVLVLINTLLDLPGLGFNELKNTLFFRYVLLSKNHGIDKALLLGITGSIQLIMDLYGDLIEQVATGQMTFNGLLEQILAAETT